MERIVFRRADLVRDSSQVWNGIAVVRECVHARAIAAHVLDGINAGTGVAVRNTDSVGVADGQLVAVAVINVARIHGAAVLLGTRRGAPEHPYAAIREVQAQHTGIVIDIDGLLGAPDPVGVDVQSVFGAGGVPELVVVEPPDGVVDRRQRAERQPPAVTVPGVAAKLPGPARVLAPVLRVVAEIDAVAFAAAAHQLQHGNREVEVSRPHIDLFAARAPIGAGGPDAGLARIDGSRWRRGDVDACSGAIGVKIARVDGVGVIRWMAEGELFVQA